MTTQDATQAGLMELRATLSRSRAYFWFIGLFSIFVNLLMLTGPLYMLQVYDSVLGSQSVPTLISLTLLVAFMYAMMGFLDHARARVMARVGAQFQSSLDQRVFEAQLRVPMLSLYAEKDLKLGGLRDLSALQRALTSPVFMSLYDLPFAPVFLFGIFLFHPYLGVLAIAGGTILVILALANRLVTKESLITSQSASHQADILSDVIAKESEMIQSMGMQKAAFARWNALRGNALDTQILGSDAQGVFSTTIKITRLFLQSAMLGLGAYLVLQKQMTPGAMIAGSILLGRALAPIEQLVNQWSVIEQGRNSYSSLAKLLGFVPVQGARTSLPKPRAKLEAQQLSVVPPGQKHATLKMVNFVIEPGSAVGVIGPSGSGKTTLARAITGVWRPVSGKVRLDGAALDQYDSQELGSYIGYLPQRVQLFDGTIRDNIARLSPDPDDRKVVEAAQKAGAHDMILSMPQGYDTSVSSGSGMLSGGQIQRIGLARAMYGDPVIIVMDEPNSNLDNAGNEALNTAIRSMKDDGKSILIMAHRPAAIQECDKLMVIEGGTLRAFGPKDDVLRQMVANHQDIQSPQTQAGVR